MLDKSVSFFKEIQSYTRNLIRQPDSLGYQTAISVAFRIANRLIAFALTWGLALVLTPGELGDYSYAYSVISVLGIFARFGLPNFVLREVSSEKVALNWRRVKGLVIWAVSLSLGASLIIIIANAVALLWIPLFPEELVNSTFYWALVLLPFTSLIPILGGILRALEKMNEGLLLNEILERFIFTGFLFFVAGVYSLGLVKDLGPSDVMAVNVVASILTCVIGGIILVRNFPSPARLVSPVYNTNQWRKPLLSFAVLGGMGILNRNIDILMLGALSSSLEVGLFKITVPFSALVVMGLTAVRLVIAPRISKFYSSNEIEKLKRVTRKATTALILMALPTSLLIVFGGRYLLSIFFGEVYLAAYIPLVILVLGQLTNSIFGPVQTVLNMTGHEKDTILVRFISLIIQIVLNILIIPQWGIIGAAISGAISTMLINVVLWLKIKQRLGFFLFPAFVKS